MRRQCQPLHLPALERPAVVAGLRWALPAGAALLLIASGHTALATLLVFAPLTEEVVFRAGLQEALLRRAAGARRGRAGAGALSAQALGPGAAWTANAVTALAFAGAHLALRPGAAAALTLFPALACGRLYERQRRVGPCVALHALFNAAWLIAAG